MEKHVTVEIADGEQVACYCPAPIATHIGDLCLFEDAERIECGKIIEESVVTDSADPSLPTIVRCATLQDQARLQENGLLANIAEERCRDYVRSLGLEMRLVLVRYSFDRKRLLVIFAADERVDFRELIKRLAADCHCRIEMRQIGVRDEAAILGGLGPCGREHCCTAWLRRFEGVNVRMARTQKVALNPSSTHGMCGRLKCCLRYEDEQYREASRWLPREGNHVDVPDGSGKVIELQVMLQRVRVRLDDGRVFSYPASDVHVQQGRRSCCGRHACTA